MTTVKYDLLGVQKALSCPSQPAEAMAVGVARVLRADVTVSVTCSAGPEPQDGQPPGTVFLATAVDRDASCHLLRISGEPREVIEQAADEALERLVVALSGSAVRR